MNFNVSFKNVFGLIYGVLQYGVSSLFIYFIYRYLTVQV